MMPHLDQEMGEARLAGWPGAGRSISHSRLALQSVCCVSSSLQRGKDREGKEGKGIYRKTLFIRIKVVTILGRRRWETSGVEKRQVESTSRAHSNVCTIIFRFVCCLCTLCQGWDCAGGSGSPPDVGQGSDAGQTCFAAEGEA